MPRYGPAVLRALAAYAEKRRAYLDSDEADERTASASYILARNALGMALDANASPAVPVLPDESERDVSPHRFGGIL